MTRNSSSAPPRAVWLYELKQVDGSVARQKVLLIFFDQERFDGYLWYSSKELQRQEEGKPSASP